MWPGKISICYSNDKLNPQALRVTIIKFLLKIILQNHVNEGNDCQPVRSFDGYKNSPCRHQKKCLDTSMENINTDVGVLILYLSVQIDNSLYCQLYIQFL